MRTILIVLALLMACIAGSGAIVSIKLLGGFHSPEAFPMLRTAFWELLAVPFASAWLALEWVRWTKHRVLLDVRRKGAWPRVAWACWIAGAWLVLELLSLWLLRRWIPELAISGLAGVGAVVLCSLAWERSRVGHCVNCGYDLRKTKETEPCPECGEMGSRHRSAAADSVLRPALPGS